MFVHRVVFGEWCRGRARVECWQDDLGRSREDSLYPFASGTNDSIDVYVAVLEFPFV